MPDMRQTEENEDMAMPGFPDETPQAIQAAQEESSRYAGALKCYFYTPKRGDIRGAFYYLFAEDGKALDELFWATRDMNGVDIDVATGWRTLKKSIPSMGAYEISLVDKLSDVALEILTPSARAELLQSTDVSEEMEKLAEELRNSFERATHYFLEIKLRLEVLSHQNLIDAGVLATGEEKAAAEASSPPQAEEEKSFTGTLITCLPIIDPVHGKPVSELVPGDLVNVKIQGGAGAGEMVQKYLTSMNQEAVFPVVTVETKGDDKTYVLLHVSEEIHGLITVTKDLRLSTVQRASVKKRVISFNVDNVIFFGTITIAIIVVLLAVKILLF
jgi:hypothetical protein